MPLPRDASLGRVTAAGFLLVTVPEELLPVLESLCHKGEQLDQAAERMLQSILENVKANRQ